jgi:hypothetical protein
MGTSYPRAEFKSPAYLLVSISYWWRMLAIVKGRLVRGILAAREEPNSKTRTRGACILNIIIAKYPNLIHVIQKIS